MAKRLFDILVSASLLLLLAPLMAIIALIVRISLGAPILFWQQRPGLDGLPFFLVKFRSMRAATSDHHGVGSDDLRLTRFGRFLRASSLDELPELWNVLTGDMSLVGPRPLLMQYLDRYTPEQARRHEVRPGLTGLAQVKGRNAMTWEDRFALDLWYVDHRSMMLDLKILGMTVLHVIRPRGINAEGVATMPEFMGRSGDIDTGGSMNLSSDVRKE